MAGGAGAFVAIALLFPLRLHQGPRARGAGCIEKRGVRRGHDDETRVEEEDADAETRAPPPDIGRPAGQLARSARRRDARPAAPEALDDLLPGSLALQGGSATPRRLRLVPSPPPPFLRSSSILPPHSSLASLRSSA